MPVKVAFAGVEADEPPPEPEFALEPEPAPAFAPEPDADDWPDVCAPINCESAEDPTGPKDTHPTKHIEIATITSADKNLFFMISPGLI